MKIREHSKRQGLRRLAGVLSLLAFPITMNWFSPYVSQLGAWSGLMVGSTLFFLSLFVSGIFLGRSFCGWLCPAGALQDLLRRTRDRRVIRGRWVKYLFWGLWFTLLIVGMMRNAPLQVEPMFLFNDGVSVGSPEQFVVYGGVVGIFLVLAIAVGRRGACHTVCWMAPFMVGGWLFGKLAKLPNLHLNYKPEVCIACGSCDSACPMSLEVSAMVSTGSPSHHDCALCGKCVDICPENVISFGFGVKERSRP